MKKHFFIHDGHFFSANQSAIDVDSRGMRYGEGLFETMRLHQNKIINADFHFERLFAGLDTLQFPVPQYYSPGYFLDSIHRLCIKNDMPGSSRIRLMVYRGKGSIKEKSIEAPHFVIETFPLSVEVKINDEGLQVDIFPDAVKCFDGFSHLKSNNYLPSVMAALFASANQLDDALIVNPSGRICESSVANIFLIKGNLITTPPLSEGCVAGTLRRWMLEVFSLENFVVLEKPVSVEDLIRADECFLTNAIYPVQWVGRFRDKAFSNTKAKQVFGAILGRLF